MKEGQSLNKMQSEFVELLTDHNVAFLVIGGQAVYVYSKHRNTSDLDILLSRSKGNARRLENMLSHVDGRPPAGKRWEDLLTQKGIRLAYPSEQNHEADLLTSIHGINFGKCYQRSLLAAFGGFTLRVPCLTDLIEMKRISLLSGNDPRAYEKDRWDIEELENLN